MYGIVYNTLYISFEGAKGQPWRGEQEVPAGAPTMRKHARRVGAVTRHPGGGRNERNTRARRRGRVPSPGTPSSLHSHWELRRAGSVWHADSAWRPCDDGEHLCKVHQKYNITHASGHTLQSPHTHYAGRTHLCRVHTPTRHRGQYTAMFVGPGQCAAGAAGWAGWYSLYVSLCLHWTGPCD